MKRVAEKQRVKGDEDDDEIEDGPATGFHKAEESILSRRPMKPMPKRDGGISNTPTPSSFFSASSTPSSAAPSTNGFLTSSTPFSLGASGGIPASSSPFSFSQKAPAPFPVSASSSSLNPRLKYYRELKGLNESLTDHLARAVAQDAFVDLSSALEQYSTHLKSIKADLAKAETTQVPTPPLSFSPPKVQQFKPAASSPFQTQSSQSSSAPTFSMPKPPGGGFKSFAGFGKQAGGVGDGDGALKTPSALSDKPASTNGTTPASGFSFPQIGASTPTTAAPSTSASSSSLFAPPPSTSSTTKEPTTTASSNPFVFPKPSSSQTTPSLFFNKGSGGDEPTDGSSSASGKPDSSTEDELREDGASAQPKGPFSFSFSKPQSTAATTTTSSTSPFSFGKPPSETSAVTPGGSSPPKTGFASFGGFGKPGGSPSGSIGNPLGFGFGSSPSGSSNSSGAFLSTSSSFGSTSTEVGKSSLFSFSSPTKPTSATSTTTTANPAASLLTPTSEAGGESESAENSRDPTPLLGGPNSYDQEGEGEENEETVHQVRCKVSVFSGAEVKSWNELGTGFLRIKKHKETSHCRLLMRNSSNGKINVNFRLHKNMSPTVKNKSITLLGYSEDQPKTFLLRTATPEAANELKTQLEANTP